MEEEMTEDEMEEMAEKAYSHVGCYADSQEDRVLGHLMKSPDMTTQVLYGCACTEKFLSVVNVVTGVPVARLLHRLCFCVTTAALDVCLRSLRRVRFALMWRWSTCLYSFMVFTVVFFVALSLIVACAWCPGPHDGR